MLLKAVASLLAEVLEVALFLEVLILGVFKILKLYFS